MRISGVSLGDFFAITDDVSWRRYEGNVIVSPDAHWTRGNSVVARLRVSDSRGVGARTAPSGRRGPYACWHAHRDVLAGLFVAHPDARIRTALAVYRGRDGFERDYPATRYRDVGSPMTPARMTDLCVGMDCGGPACAPIAQAAEAQPTPAREENAVLARIEEELRRAEEVAPEPLVFEGPPSLAGVPDLAYSGR
ncbi:hypothetical protein DVA86_27270 [Streptomyces armeniacus]|uniref:Uncharacterized protein n=1 Tax=Streptomyces armeniacus TaxID=83291 RepID=A0A345XVW5_9ACTN|nr:hypothetical protein [Streptomyces armeniacus]AXK35781.1 hypothetical protein DVA86_27270 [Streptomyces armeniacus]